MIRRSFLSGTLASVFPGFTKSAVAQIQGDIEILDASIPRLPDDLTQFASSGPFSNFGGDAVGAARPLDEEKIQAREILLESPFNCSLLEVVAYFHALSGDLEIYKREWPRRANPLIAHFFSATQTQPEGDTTAWCAAALNWWILRSRAVSRNEIGLAGSFSAVSGSEPLDFSNEAKAFGTHSASSGSFRCWGIETPDPLQGDVLVLANQGTEGLRCYGRGHVAVYLRHLEADSVEVIGGNQSDPSGSNGAITRARVNIGLGSRFLKFVTDRNR